MSRFVVSLVVLFAGCKTEPAATKATPSPSAPQAVKPRAPVRIPTSAGARPSLPATTAEFNPPGIPPLTGEIHEGEHGLQYIDEVVGTGRTPEKGKPATVHYSGYLSDGTAFDSSHDRDEPMTYAYDSGLVIKGWDLGLETMRVGGKRRLLIPADLAFGASGAGDVIPPNAVLLFDVELVDVGGK